MKAAHIIVSGLVQGVGFRYFVMNKARQLGLMGYVKNTLNGDVEMLAKGNVGMLNQFIEEIKIGPISSDVRNAKIEWIEVRENFSDFTVRF